MSRVFIETNVVVYAHGDDERRPMAGAVLKLAPVISAQVLTEFVNVARRKLAFDWRRLDQAIEDVTALCPVVLPITPETHSAARRLAERYRVRIFDAQIIASALEAGCDTLFSEDMHDGLIVEDRLTIRNPFA